MEHFQLFHVSEVLNDDEMKVYDHNSAIISVRTSIVFRASLQLPFVFVLNTINNYYQFYLYKLKVQNKQSIGLKSYGNNQIIKQSQRRSNTNT